jgi:hypothetical protein
LDSTGAVKRGCKNNLYTSIDSSHDTPYMSWEYSQAVSENGSHDCHGVCESSRFKGETHQWVRAAQSNQSEGRSDTKGGYQLAHLEPHRGDPALSSFISESGLEDFLHTHLWADI